LAAPSSASNGELAVCCTELSLLSRRQARLDAAVDPILAPPGVDLLVAEVEITSDVDDLAAGGQQIENLPTELRWIPTASHICLLHSGGTRTQYQPLRQTRGTPSPDTPGDSVMLIEMWDPPWNIALRRVR
jgi:hypothetical protein